MAFGRAHATPPVPPASADPPTDPTSGRPPEPSEEGSARIVVERGLVFAEVDGTALKLDLYRPGNGAGAPYPVLLFYHGGGWVSGTRRDAVPDDDPRARALAAESGHGWPSMLPYVHHGLALASADYRLAPANPEPAAIEDALRALAWVAREGPGHGLDPSRVVLAGASAGGHLALMTALTETSGLFLPAAELGEPPPRVLGVIDLYGVADVADLLGGPNAKTFTAQWVPSRSLERARRLSPIAYVRPALPPALIVHGDADRIVPYAQSAALATAWAAAGGTIELLTLPGGAHGWFDAAEQRRIRGAILAFLSDLDLATPGPRTPQDGEAGGTSESRR